MNKMIELVIIVFIISLMGGIIVRLSVQRRNDKVINQLVTENELLKRGYNTDYNDGDIYDSDGKRVR